MATDVLSLSHREKEAWSQFLQAEACLKESRTHDAIHLYEDACRALEESYSVMHWRTCYAMDRLAQALASESRFAAAKEIFIRALEAAEQVEYHLRATNEQKTSVLSFSFGFADLACNCAHIEEYLSKYVSGESHLRKALGMLKDQLDQNITQIATVEGGILYPESISTKYSSVMMELAGLLCRHSSASEAQHLYEQVIAYQETTAQMNLHIVAKAQASLIEIHKQLNNYGSATTIARRHLQNVERLFGPHHEGILLYLYMISHC